MNIYVVIGSVLEMIGIYNIHCILGLKCDNAGKSSYIIITLSAIVTVILDHFQLPF